MKKKIALIFTAVCVLCLSACLLAGCASGKSETKKLVVGFDEGYPPFGYISSDGSNTVDGTHTGFDLEVAKKACEDLGWEVEFTPIDWDTKDSYIESGSITCIWNGFTMEGREDQYSFTEPYYLNEQVILTKANSGIATLEDLKGKDVLAQTNSAAFNLLSEGGDQEELASTFASLQTIPNYQTAMMQLESGAVDAIAIDRPVAESLIADKTGYVVLDEVLTTEHYGVGFKKGNTEDAQKLNDELKKLYEDGTIAEIAKRYEDQGLNVENWILK